ncbi:MAG: hypothetical protein ACFFBU_05505 [Promethearchaeota archaeon]
MSSRISRNVQRVGEILRASAEDQIQDYSVRFKALEGMYDSFLHKLICTDFSPSEAYKIAQSFFGDTTVHFAAVDGTQYVQPLFDLLVFFAGSYTCRGTLNFHPDEPPSIKYEDRLTKGAAAISTVAPVYINKVPDIDQEFFDPLDGEVIVERPLSDQYIINNSSIADVLMTFSEYFLAYRLAISPVQKIQILLLDRTLGGSYSSLLYDTARRFGWNRNLGMLGVHVDGTPITEEDFLYCRHRIINSQFRLPPVRGDFLRHAILYHLEQSAKPLTFNTLCTQLDLDTSDRQNRADKFLQKAIKEGFVTERREHFKLKERYKNSWRRITHLVRQIGNQIFSEELSKDPLTSHNRLQVRVDGRYSWLSTLDIAFLTLFSLYMLIEECWRRKILLIGVTKDTAARDFKRQLIPILWQSKLLLQPKNQRALERAPNTDRMILQSISHFVANKLQVPWSTIEYDEAFRTMVPDRRRPRRTNYVGGARRNRIGLERTFLKSYIQLTEAKSDSKLRSNVLFIDRLAHPEFDGVTDTSIGSFFQEYGGATEPVQVLLNKDNTVPNPLQTLTLSILSSLSCSSIPEAFGHNKPLMVADKVAKFHQHTFSNVITGTANWISVHPHLRSFVFYLSSFRERRSRIESFRKSV